VIYYAELYLLRVPDILFFVVIFIMATIAWRGSLVESLRSGSAPGRDEKMEARLVLGVSAIMVWAFLTFSYFVLPVAAGYTMVLPRYYTAVLPFLLLWVAYIVDILLRDRFRHATTACLGLMSFVFALNAGGALYPEDVDVEGPGNNFAITERSLAYMQLAEIQRESVEFLKSLPEDAQVYYGHHEHYLFTYPELGYAAGPLRNGHNLWTEQSIGSSRQPESFQDCLYLLYNYPWLGGDNIRAFMQYVDTREDLEWESMREFRNGHYVIRLFRVRPEGLQCPA
jgi:hypothetical protein